MSAARVRDLFPRQVKHTFSRSAVYAKNGMVAASQPLACDAGVSILKSGGNAIDAAIAVAGMLAVTEPCSTGIGGDAFLLYYDASKHKVFALNGSGKSAASGSLDDIYSTFPQHFEQDAGGNIPSAWPNETHGLTVTVQSSNGMGRRPG